MIESKLFEIRRCDGKSAIIFLHGFTGNAEGTWDRFPLLLRLESSIDSWNILSLSYSTSFLPGTRGIWSADPDLPTLSGLFLTELKIPPLSGYHRIAVVAHSMGGLIVQQTLVDNPELKERVRHVFLLGTPSAGITKANRLARLFGPLIGEQVHNMKAGGRFITDLRAAWKSAFGDEPPFQFYAIAGDKDQFVTTDTALEPFAKKYRRIVPGDHLSMVKPKDEKTEVVRLLVSALAETAEPEGPASELRIAAELGEKAPEGMEIARQAAAGNRRLRSEVEVVEAALALDRAGQQPEAIQLLEQYQHFGTDVKGTLAGRIKRRWVQEGQEGDAYWALGLYESALRTARAKEESQEVIGQIFYHAINVAYLKQVAFGKTAEAQEMARLALDYSRKKRPVDVWSVATEAEAWLYLGDEQQALQKYRQVTDMSPEKWKLLSTGQQAQQIACKQGNVLLQEKLRSLFDSEIGRAAV